MHSPKKILIASVHPWNSPFLKAGDHHYAELLARNGHNVFWISHHVSIPSLFKKHNSAWVASALKGVRTTNRITSYTPFTLLPYMRIPPFNTLWAGTHHLRFAIPPVKNVLESYGFRDVDIMLMSDPSLFYLTNIVKYKTLALRIVDDLAGVPTAAKSLLDLQRMAIQKADHVFITSQELMKYNVSGKKNFWYLPNAVDPDHFKGPFDLPVEYKDIPSPRILYVGSLFQRIDRIDIDLIVHTAQSLPSYNFIFVGPQSISLDAFKNKKNVFLLGPRSYQDIGAYMKHADAGIIPFKQNALTKSMSAIKLFQYLAAGLPVVSSRMPELEAMKPPVYFAASKEEFITTLQIAYREGKNHAEFFEFAKKNSWADRYKSMADILGI